jgi:hypothetical protein
MKFDEIVPDANELGDTEDIGVVGSDLPNNLYTGLNNVPVALTPLYSVRTIQLFYGNCSFGVWTTPIVGGD